MTETPPVPPVSTFVVRFWREWSVAGPRWRGQVDHLQSGKTARFLDLDELLAIIHSFGVMGRQASPLDSIREEQDPHSADGSPLNCKCEGSDRPRQARDDVVGYGDSGDPPKQRRTGP